MTITENLPHTHNGVSIDDDVDVLTEQLHALRALGQQYDVTDDQIYDLSIRWGAALAGRWRRLLLYHSAGVLHVADKCRFAELCDDLRSVSGLVERFDLARPELPSVSADPDPEKDPDPAA